MRITRGSGQIEHGGRVVGGGVLALPRLGAASSVGMTVLGGGVLRLPSLTRLSDPVNGNWWELTADGLGSVLDLSSVSFLDGGDTIAFRATASARLLLPNLLAVDTGVVQFLSEGEGSLVDLSSPMSLVPNNGSSIKALNMGIVALPSNFNSTGIEFVGVTPGIVHPVAPQITQQPAEQTVPLGSAATFTLIAGGTLPISYRWQLEATQNNWQNLSGQTGPSLTVTGVSYGKEGRYRCILVNYGGLVISRAAQLRVGNTPPPDAEGDWLLDEWELRYWSAIATYGPSDDPDADGLTNLQEYQRGIDPTKKDTDGDGFNDLTEIRRGANPLDPNSTPPPTLEIFVEQVRVEFAASAGQSFMIQGSPDLTSWTNLERVDGTGDVVNRLFQVNEVQRYFRVIKL